jgi:uncharacterized lipoprotein YajG
MGKKVLSGSVAGKVNLDAEIEIRLASPKIKLIGDIEHDGKQTSTGDISSSAGSISAAMNVSAGQNISDSVRTMAQDREIYNGHKHPNDTPNTQDPIQKQ